MNPEQAKSQAKELRTKAQKIYRRSIHSPGELGQALQYVFQATQLEALYQLPAQIETQKRPIDLQVYEERWAVDREERQKGNRKTLTPEERIAERLAVEAEEKAKAKNRATSPTQPHSQLDLFQ